MGKRIAIGSLFVFLAACGGHIDPSAGDDSRPAPSRDDEQGIYLPPKPGGPDSIADGLGLPTAIAMTDESVLFTTRTTTIGGERVEAGALYVADKRVGPALVLTVDRQGASYEALATDAHTAFVATSDARLLSISVSGGAPTTLATLPSPAVTVTASGDYVYYATEAGAVGRIAKSGGDPKPLTTVTGTVRGLAVVDGVAVFAATGATAKTPAGIVRVSLTGGDVSVLAAGREPCAMVRDDQRLFWTSGTLDASPAGKGEVLRMSIDGGEVATVASGAFAACAIAADRDSLYFASMLPAGLPVKAGGVTGSGEDAIGLMRAPIAGGEPVALTGSVGARVQPGAITVDATHLYWLTATAVLRARK